MASIAIRQSAWAAGTPAQKKALLLTMEKIGLGDADEGAPPLYKNPSGVTYFVWDDDRFTLRDAAILGAIGARLASLVPSMLPLSRSKVMLFIAANVVWPGAIDYVGSTNPWQATLDAQGAPNWMLMADSVPPNWTPA